MKHNLREILHVHDCDVADSHFANATLTHARFQHVDLRGSKFTDVDCSGVIFDCVNLRNAAISRSAIGGMTIDGVLVSDLLAAYEARARSSQSQGQV